MTSSAPVKTIIIKPKGIPNPPNIKLFWPVVPPQRPPTWEDIRAPRPRNKPPSTDRKNSLRWPYCAFFFAPAMNCSRTSGLVNCARRESDMDTLPGWMPDIVRVVGVVVLCDLRLGCGGAGGSDKTRRVRSGIFTKTRLLRNANRLFRACRHLPCLPATRFGAKQGGEIYRVGHLVTNCA